MTKNYTINNIIAYYELIVNIWLPLVDEFRTLNWIQIKRDIEFSKIFEMFPMMVLQNS